MEQHGPVLKTLATTLKEGVLHVELNRPEVILSVWMWLFKYHEYQRTREFLFWDWTCPWYQAMNAMNPLFFIELKASLTPNMTSVSHELSNTNPSPDAFSRAPSIPLTAIATSVQSLSQARDVLNPSLSLTFMFTVLRALLMMLANQKGEP